MAESVMFQHWKTDYGFTRSSGRTYEFLDVDGVSNVVNIAKHLTRGANSKNKKGIAYQENGKQASVGTFTASDLPGEIFDVLTEIYENEERIDVYMIDSKTGKNVMYKDALLSQPPIQTEFGDGDTYAITLAFESFNIVWKVNLDNAS